VRAQDISAETVLVERILDAHCARAVGCLYAPDPQHTRMPNVGALQESSHMSKVFLYVTPETVVFGLCLSLWTPCVCVCV